MYTEFQKIMGVLQVIIQNHGAGGTSNFRDYGGTQSMVLNSFMGWDITPSRSYKYITDKKRCLTVELGMFNRYV